MESGSKEARIILAIEAIKMRHIKSRREAVRVYNVPESTLRVRMAGKSALVER